VVQLIFPVRSRVEEVLQVPANCEIDPTTAVTGITAAATKPKEISENKKKRNLNFYKIIL
jgi:molecular chaperone DnaK